MTWKRDFFGLFEVIFQFYDIIKFQLWENMKAVGSKSISNNIITQYFLFIHPNRLKIAINFDIWCCVSVDLMIALRKFQFNKYLKRFSIYCWKIIPFSDFPFKDSSINYVTTGRRWFWELVTQGVGGVKNLKFSYTIFIGEDLEIIHKGYVVSRLSISRFLFNSPL